MSLRELAKKHDATVVVVNVYTKRGNKFEYIRLVTDEALKLDCNADFVVDDVSHELRQALKDVREGK